MYGYANPTAADQRAAMSTLAQKGIVTVEIEFSGGNDEGGVDSVLCFDANGDEVKGAVESGNAYETQEYNHETRTYGPNKWVVSTYDDGKYGLRDATADEVAAAALAKVLEAPVYDRYGSFAGEFDVFGKVTWDVAAGKHKMTGQESETVWNSF